MNQLSDAAVLAFEPISKLGRVDLERRVRLLEKFFCTGPHDTRVPAVPGSELCADCLHPAEASDYDDDFLGFDEGGDG